MKILQWVLVVFVLCGVQADLAMAQDDDGALRAPPPQDGPIEVRTGFQLFDISGVDEKEETIDFSGGIYMLWMDPRLAYDPAEVGMDDWVPGNYSTPPRRLYQDDFAVKELYPGWKPHLSLSNGVGNRQKNIQAIGIFPDGTVLYAERFSATVETSMNLRMFPFDQQSVKVYFHPFLYSRSEVLLVHSDILAGSWQEDTGIAEWSKLNMEFSERPLEYTLLNGERKVFSELVVTIDIGRKPEHVLFSIVLPLFILVALTWCVFWMDESSVSDRVNITFIGILTVVSYYFVIMDGVPEIPYLTMMDGFMLVTFVILAVTVVMSFVVDKLNRAGRRLEGDRVDRVARWAFPVGYVTAVGLIVLVFSIAGR